MTTHYIDLRVVPDPEINAPQLMSALFGKLHQALVALKANDIGVSFPQYSRNPRSIGSVLRLHSTDTSLRQLMDTDWLKGIRDHIRMTEISSIPTIVEHRSVMRKQFKTSAERLRRRRMKRKGESAEQAIHAIPKTMERTPDLPFLRIHSRSTGQGFHVFIALGPIQPSPTLGPFNSYGLGGSTTIPWF